MTDTEKYLKVLFDIGERTACANDIKDCRAVPQSIVIETPPQWVTVNPFHTWKLDRNVTAFRNLVVEYDKGLTVDEQLPFMLKKGFPFSTAVYSGNKSIHFTCSLSEPMSDVEEFREVRRWLDVIFPGADKSMKDPARFTRCAGGTNAGTGKLQDMVVLSRRVSPHALSNWLSKFDAQVKAHDEAQARMLEKSNELRERGELSPSQWRFLRGEEGVKAGGSRHSRLFAIVCDLCDVVGMDYKEALSIAIECADLQGITADVSREGEAEKIVYDVYFKRGMR